MKITLESTRNVVGVQAAETPGAPPILARLWVGQTDKGVPVHAFLIAISPQTHDPAVLAEFERDLNELKVELGETQWLAGGRLH